MTERETYPSASERKQRRDHKDFCSPPAGRRRHYRNTNYSPSCQPALPLFHWRTVKPFLIFTLRAAFACFTPGKRQLCLPVFPLYFIFFMYIVSTRTGNIMFYSIGGISEVKLSCSNTTLVQLGPISRHIITIGSETCLW